MRLDKYICSGGRIDNKDATSIWFNGYIIFPLFEPDEFYNSYTISINKGVSDNDFEFHYPNGIPTYVDTNRECFNSYNPITSWGNGRIDTERKHPYRRQGTYEILSNSVIYADAMYETTVKSVNYIRPDIIDGSHLFDGFRNVTTSNLFLPETSYMTDMSYMFQNCIGLTSLNLSGFDTSNVTNMFYMFAGCSNLESLDLSGWDLNNVTDMRYMFLDCIRLNTIRLDNCGRNTVRKINEELRNATTAGGNIYIQSGLDAGINAPEGWRFVYVY